MSQAVATSAVVSTAVEPEHDRSIWPFFAVAVVAVILAAAICWSLAHPFGIHWDEAEYLDEVLIDSACLRSGLLPRVVGRLLFRTWGIPPAFRILAIPFLAVFGFHATLARLTSLGCYGLSCWFIYLATRRLAGRLAGAFAALVFSLSPEVISGSIFFSTDAPLYLATAATLYCVLVYWSEGIERRTTWIGLGLAFGFGFLAKTSFLLIGPPVLLLWLVLSRWERTRLPGLSATSLWKAGALAFLIGGPWWLANFKSAFAYGQYAQAFVRDSLGPPSLATFARWFNTVLQCLLGHGVSILTVLILAAVLLNLFVKRESFLSPLQKAALGACACAGLPIVAAQLSGTNHLLRHITPSMVPFAIAVGMLADRADWTRSRTCLIVSAVLFCGQLGMLVAPVVHPNTQQADLGFDNAALPWRTMSRFDQWDWRLLMNISDSCGVSMPRISFLGSGRTLDPPQIQYPWIFREASSHGPMRQVPDVMWLWRYEDGPLDWQKVMDGANKSDFVLTAPHYLGEVENKEDLDNQHNLEFAERLSQDPRFQAPFHIKMGRFQPVDVLVFVKKTLTCRVGQSAAAQP